MSTTVTIAGTQYTIPSPGEDWGWGGNINSVLSALSTQLGSLQSTGFSVGVQNTPYNATGNGTTDDRGAFAAADAAVTASGGVVHVPAGTYRFASTFTGSSDVIYFLDPGAILKPDSGATVTINLRAGYHQIASGAGTVIPSGVPYMVVQWWGAVPDVATSSQADTNNAAFEAAAAAATSSTTVNAVFAPGREFYVKDLLWPTTRHIALFGYPKRGTTIRQHSGVTAGAQLFLTDAAGSQEGPLLKHLIFQGHANGGNVVEFSNVEEGVMEDCQIVQGSSSYALLRVRNNSIGNEFRDIRLHMTTSGGAKYGIWVGDSADGSSPATSNNTFRNVQAREIDTGEGFVNGHAIYCTSAGATEFSNVRLENMECADAVVKVVGGRSLNFHNCKTEFGPAANGTVDYHFESCKLIQGFRTAAGHLTDTPTAFKLVGVENMVWRDAFIRGTINADANCKNVHWQGCQFNSLTLTGSGVGFPNMVFDEACTTVSSIREITAQSVDGPATFTGILRGTTAPEGSVTAPVGVLFIHTDGTAGDYLYLKKTGSGNTGWVVVA